MIERGLDAAAVVDVHREKAVVPRAVPDCDDRDVDALEVPEQARLISHVADDHDRVALARLEHGCEYQSLVGALARMAEHDAVPALPRLERERVDRAREERVGDIPDDRAEQHRRRTSQAACEWVRPVARARRRRRARARASRGRSGTSSGASLRIRETVLCATPAALRDVLHRRRPPAALLARFSSGVTRPDATIRGGAATLVSSLVRTAYE